MPQRIDIPGQGIVEFPDGMSDADITKVIQANSKPTPSLLDRTQALASGVNTGLGAVLPGLPVDTVLNVGDLAKAVAGLAYHAFNQDSAVPDWATPSDRSKMVGSSEWIQNNLRKGGLGNFIDASRPDDTASRYLHSAGLVAGTSLVPGQGVKETAKSAMIAALSGGAGQAAAESGHPEYSALAALLTPSAVRGGASAAQAVAKPIGAVGNMVLPGGATRLLNQYQNEIVGPNSLPVKTALETAPEIVPGSQPTAGEAVAGLPEGSPIIAHQKQIAQVPGGPSGAFGQRFDEQQAARRNSMGNVAQSPQDLSAAITQRSQVASPLYEQARASTNPVDVTPVLSKIDLLLEKNPGNPALVTTLNQIKAGLMENGQPRTSAQEISSSLDGIKAAIANKDNAFIKGNLNEIKDDLTKSIPGYAQAQQTFADMSKPVNQMQIGQYLQDKLTTAKGAEQYGAFAQSLRDALGTIKRSTGEPRYSDLAKIMTHDQMNILNSIQADLARKQDYLSPTQRTNLTGSLNPQGIELPHMLSKPLVLSNYLLKILGHDVEGKMNTEAAQRYLNPKELAKVLKTPQATKLLNTSPERMADFMKNNPGLLGIQGMTQGVSQ